MRRSLVLAVALALAARAAAGQILPVPRDRPNGPPSATGTGAIKGRVVDGATGRAIARARVRLNGMGGPGQARPPVTTDESGAFAFTQLPVGSFMLTAEKATYLMGRFPDTGQTIRSSARPLTLTDGQVMDRVTVSMFHGGTLSGRVLDAYGDPVEAAQVQALRLPKSGGRPQPRFGGMSNDLGEFRVPRLEPGQYLLLVTPQRRDMFPMMVNRPEVDEPPEPQPVPTYYPGVLAMSQAQPIAIERGTTVSDLEVTVIEGVVATVTGTLVDASGQPITRGGSIGVRTILKDVAQNSGGMTGAGVRPDGTFRLRLPPGEYELEGHAAPAMGGRTMTQEETGSIRLNVNADVSGLTIRLGPGATISGRVLFEGTHPVPPIPADQNQFGPGSVMFTSVDGSMCRPGRGETAPDWTFTIEGVSGTCTPRVNFGAAQWFLKSITHDGRELQERPITLTTGQQLRDVEIVMTDKRTELTFHVTDEHGSATREYVGLVFSTDRSKWTDAMGRYIRLLNPPPDRPGGVAATAVPGATPASRAREMVLAVPPGEYFAIAVDDLPVEGYRDPEFLEALARGAGRTTLAAGVPADITLRRLVLTSPK